MEGVKGEMQSGNDQKMTVPVTLEELYTGVNRVDHVRRRVICRMCRIDESHEKCRSCGRCPNEVKMVNRQIGPGMVVQQQQEVKSKERCTQEVAKLQTEIERGMRDGDTITFPHMAEQNPGVLPGDVVLTLEQKKHSKFRRKANDLYIDKMQISLREALLGFSRKIEHLDDHYVEFSNDKITAPGQLFKIAGEGMPHKDDPTQFGSLYLKAEIQMPKGKLTSEQAELVDKLFPKQKHSLKEEL